MGGCQSRYALVVAENLHHGSIRNQNRLQWTAPSLGPLRLSSAASLSYQHEPANYSAERRTQSICEVSSASLCEGNHIALKA